jgi:hypothetical protein
LKNRWPARYATTLADDPGSAVLTLTSLGMTQLSRPLDPKTGEPAAPSRVIALWADKSEPAREIKLPEDAEALVLTLTERREEEWTADGRGDGGVTGAISLANVYPVRKKTASGAVERLEAAKPHKRSPSRNKAVAPTLRRR